jgi:hypothetical protein
LNKERSEEAGESSEKLKLREISREWVHCAAGTAKSGNIAGYGHYGKIKAKQE